MRGTPAFRTFGAMDVAVLAGVVSTGLFAMSYMPMLVKAARTKDLSSYSLGNLAITNLGNVVYSLYVFSLPFGPIWFLHSFYLVACGLMLVWFLHYGGAWRRFVARRRAAWRAHAAANDGSSQSPVRSAA
ncbi:hypothetical protein [Agromyces neolithicus]|uniref:PQ-loop repeat-containing protein n=1 Tax=Agromyces neolithicus TaxID=269420 RepID=A0ABP4Y9G0_9MICO